MNEYVIGIEDHYAWANLVSVSTAGDRDVLLDSRRVELLDPPLPAAPYHRDTLDMPAADAEALVRAVVTSANARAELALSLVTKDLAPAVCRGIAIRISPLEQLPKTVAEAHADARVVNRADGMIYHQALTRAAERLHLPVFSFEKHTVLERAALERREDPHGLELRLKAFGKTHKPWRKGQVLACAGAIVARATRGRQR